MCSIPILVLEFENDEAPAWAQVVQFNGKLSIMGQNGQAAGAAEARE